MQAQQTPSDAVKKNQGVLEKSKEVVHNVTGYVEEKKEALDHKLEEANHYVDEKTNVLGEKLDAARQAAVRGQRKMEAGYLERVSPALEQATDGIDTAATYLRASTPGQMIDDVIAAGKRHPKEAAGILFGLGFLLARKLYGRG